MAEDGKLLRHLAQAVASQVRDTPHAEFGKPGGMGASGEPAKRIDRIAEQVILDEVEALDAELNVCSEEVGRVDRGAERTLIVDPVDGTTNAARGIPFYCVSLAISRGGLQDVERGLVLNIPTGELYEAARGQGATKDGKPLEPRSFDADHIVISPLLDPQRLPRASPALRSSRYMRNMGAAALELCLVAQGAMDVYLNTTNGLRIVDIAAGMLILEEAGGRVLTLEGERPELPLDVRERTHLVAVGDPAALEELGVPG